MTLLDTILEGVLQLLYIQGLHTCGTSLRDLLFSLNSWDKSEEPKSNNSFNKMGSSQKETWSQRLVITSPIVCAEASWL